MRCDSHIRSYKGFTFSEIVKLEKKYAIPGKIYELCEQAKRMSEVEAQPGDYCAVCGSQEFWNNNEEEE